MAATYAAMAAKRRKEAAAEQERLNKLYPLPKGIVAKDLVYPKKGTVYDVASHGQFTMYYTEGNGDFGWVITTLRISSAGRQATARTYGIELDNEKLVSVGKGPHVKREVTVYIAKDRQKALQKYIDLYNKGMEMAGGYRDNLSTRRARTRMRRSVGGFFY